MAGPGIGGMGGGPGKQGGGAQKRQAAGGLHFYLSPERAGARVCSKARILGGRAPRSEGMLSSPREGGGWAPVGWDREATPALRAIPLCVAPGGVRGRPAGAAL